ncbi:MAG: hypothetical protein IT323_04505 [Anaerolineae bacterium]|nr:hypothetical protein [Anaerolineae bacterium]
MNRDSDRYDRYEVDLDAEKPKNDQPGGFKLDGRTIAIGLLIIVAAFIFLPRLFSSEAQTAVPTPFAPNNAPIQQGNITLPQPVASTGVDADGCATGVASTFSSAQSIYVVAENSSVPNGTGIFVRLYRDGQPVEDAPEIVADRDYSGTCINFVFEPVNQPFQPGDYEAQFVVNGNPGPSVTFRVQ